MASQCNQAEPEIMHIDLNSCFAMIEQQANPHLRGRPIAVAAYTTGNGTILAPSYEAKQFGVRTGMRLREAKLLCPDLQAFMPDPPKYRFVHLKLRAIFDEFCGKVSPKSIDEAVLDFSGSHLAKTHSLTALGQQIKTRIREELGDWLTCNVGISTNRFLAKLAASLHKPDGLDIITAENLLATLDSVKLRQLCGINYRLEARLNQAGIYSPLDLYAASEEHLRKRAFHSVVGHHWYLRLRGFEVDAIDFGRKSFGQSYALHHYTNNDHELGQLLLKLCEKMGRRLRRHGYLAYGVHVSCQLSDRTFWQRSQTGHRQLYATLDLYRQALHILQQRPHQTKVAHLAVSCFHLAPSSTEQLALFTTHHQALLDSLDQINDTYGEFTVVPASMVAMNNIILDRLPFGGTGDSATTQPLPSSLG